MASTAQMQRPILGLEEGRPYEIALKYPTGKAVSNGRIMFSTTEGEVFFVDQFDAEMIYGLELRPQEPFRIMRRNRQIQVERCRVERQVSEAPAAPAIVPQQKEQSQPQSNSLSAIMAASYVSAIDALQVAQQYAEKHGVPFRISPAEIRACAHCIFIQAGRTNGVAR